MDAWRTAICNISMRTKEKIVFLEAKEKKLLEVMRMKDIKNMRTNISNKLMLDGLEMEQAKHWPTVANLATKINADVIIPQTVINHAEYT